jgi:hypothetical protein
LGAAEIALGRLYRDVAKEKLDLLKLAASGTTEPSATPPEIVGCEFAHATFRRELFDDVPDELLRHLSPQTLPALLTRRKRLPLVIPAAFIHSSKRSRTQSGTGTVRT